MSRHIDVARNVIIRIIATILIIIGIFWFIFYGRMAALGLMALGIIMGTVSKFMFRVKTKQLDIDAKEALRDKLSSNICPSCRQRLKRTDFKFCPYCAYKL